MWNLLKTLKSVEKKIHIKAIRFFLYKTQQTNAILIIQMHSRLSAVICSYNFPCLKADKSSYCKPVHVVFLSLGTLKLFLLVKKKKSRLYKHVWKHTKLQRKNWNKPTESLFPSPMSKTFQNWAEDYVNKLLIDLISYFHMTRVQNANIFISTPSEVLIFSFPRAK